jgi:hypothetical protein
MFLECVGQFGTLNITKGGVFLTMIVPDLTSRKPLQAEAASVGDPYIGAEDFPRNSQLSATG